MTVSATPRKAGPFAGTGAQTAFPFTFKIFATTDVVVTTVVTATSVQATPVNGTDYTVAMNGDQEAAPGGTVNMIVAPAVGVSLVVSSAVPSTQSVAVTNNGGFFPAVFNTEFDKLTVLIQQLEEKATRTLSSPITAAGVSGSVSPVANAVLVWDGTGQNILSIPQTTLAASFVYNNATYQAALVTSLAANTNVFGNLNMGGLTAAFPMWKRVGTGMSARLADDSADAPVSASGLTLSSDLFMGGATSATAKIKRAGTVLSVRLGDDSGDAPLTASTFTASVGFVLGVLGSLKASADGVFQLLNNAGTAFTRLCFGGTTNAFPALKRSAAALAVVLADDSGDATMTAKTQAAGDASTNVATTAFANALQGFRNRLINGDMRVDQRNAGAVATGAYGPDRWRGDASQAGKFTLQVATATPPAATIFDHYLRATSSSAYAVGASETFLISQAVEGYNTQDLLWGSAAAKSVTIGFWARSSLTGNFGAVVSNAAGTRSYPFTYTIAAANTWQFFTVAVPGDTAGAWSTGNAVGLWLRFSLGSGATVSGAAAAWAGALYYSVTGSVSLVGTNAATLDVTGIQLEPGALASVFDRRPFAVELALCQRYYEVGGVSAVGTFYSASNASPATLSVTWGFQAAKRASPTIAVFNAGPWSFDDAGVGTAVMTTPTVAIQRISPTGTRLNLGCTSSTGTYTQYHVAASGGDYFSADAEF